MPTRLLWIMLLSLLCLPVMAGTMNKCMHPDGRVEFTDAPCAPGTATNLDKRNEATHQPAPPGDGLTGLSSITLLAGNKGSSGAVDGVGESARFNNPGGIVRDGQNLYIVDTSNRTIRKLELTTGKVTTLAGKVAKRGHKNGVGTDARFNIPQGIAVDGDHLYVTDVMSYCIRKISISTGEVSTFAGKPGTPGRADGLGKEATFSAPSGITAVGGNLYVADRTSSTIRKIELATGKVSTFAGKTVLVEMDASTLSHFSIKLPDKKMWNHVTGNVDGVGQDARFGWPTGITHDGTHLYVSDSYNNNIRKISIATGEVTKLAGPDEASCAAGFRGRCPGGVVDGPASKARFNHPQYLATDGKYLYLDSSNNVIRRVSLATGQVQTLVSGQAGSTTGREIARQLKNIWGLAVSDGHGLIVADRLGNAIYRLQ